MTTRKALPMKQCHIFIQHRFLPRQTLLTTSIIETPIQYEISASYDLLSSIDIKLSNSSLCFLEQTIRIHKSGN